MSGDYRFFQLIFPAVIGTADGSQILTALGDQSCQAAAQPLI